MYKLLKSWIIIIVLLSSMTAWVFAQDDEPVPTPVPDTVVEVTGDVDFIDTGTQWDSVINQVLAGLAAIIYLPAAAGYVTILTSITKRFITSVGVNLIVLFWMLVAWAVYTGLTQFGIDVSQYGDVSQKITELGYTLLALTGTPVISAWFYDKAKAANVPIVGYSRSEQG